MNRTDRAYYWHMNNGFSYSDEYKNYQDMKDTGIYIYYKYEQHLPEDMLERIEKNIPEYFTYTALLKRYEVSIHGKPSYAASLFNKMYEAIKDYKFKPVEMDYLWFSLKENFPIEKIVKYIGKGYSRWELFKLQRGLSCGLTDEDIQKYLFDDYEGRIGFFNKIDMDSYCRHIEEEKRKEEIQKTIDLVAELSVGNEEKVFEEKHLKQKKLREELFPNLKPIEYKPNLHIILPLIIVPAISVFYILKRRGQSNG